MDLSNVTDWLFGRGAYAKPSPPNDPLSNSTGGRTYLSQPPSQYPTDEDVDFARKNDWSYGQPWAPEFNNKSARIQIENPFAKGAKQQQIGGGKFELSRTFAPAKDVVAKAALAVENSGLAKLGFDPNRAGLDVWSDPHGGKTLENLVKGVAGLNMPDEDRMYANAFMPDSL